MKKQPYRIVGQESTASSRELADWLAKDGQLLVPLVELLEKGGTSHRRSDRRHGPGDGRSGPPDERRTGGGAEGAGAPRTRPGGVLAWRARRPDRVERTAIAGRRAAAAEEAAACRRVGRGRGSGLHGAAGGSDVGAGAQRGVDAALRAGAAGDGRPGGHQQVGGLAGDH